MKINELTKFAITLGLLPFIPAYLLYRHGLKMLAVDVISVFLALSFMCFISKEFGERLKAVLEKTGSFLGRYLAVIVLIIVYIIAVLPTGLIMKLVKRDRLMLKKKNVSTYWKKFEKNTTDYEYQF